MSRVGDDVVEAFEEMAAHLRGDGTAESYKVPPDVFTADRIRGIRTKLSASTRAFETEFAIPARTIKACDQGRHRPIARQ